MRNTEANYHPDALIRQPIGCLVEEIAGYIRRLRPQVVLTHDPYGGYGHPDHVRVCEAVTAAFHLVRVQANGDGEYDGPQKLYYTAFDKRILRLIVRVMPIMGHDPRAIGRNRDIDLIEIARWETPVHTKVHVADYLDRKLRASEAHASQFSGGPGFLRFLPEFLRQRFLESDTFTLAFPAPDGELETDLFDGIV